MIILVVLETKFVVSVIYIIIKIRYFSTAYDIKFATGHGKTQKYKRGKKKKCCNQKLALKYIKMACLNYGFHRFS